MLISFEFDMANEIWIGKLTGDLDIYNVPAFVEATLNKLGEHPASLKLDCSALEYVDSAGLGAIVKIYKHLSSSGKHSVRLTNLRPYINKIFRITELDKLFEIEVAS